MEDSGKQKPALAIGIIILLALGFYLAWRYSKGGVENTPPTLGEQVSDQTQTPTDSVPNVNPYKTETNPFEKANPLKNIYKNPFE